jgi:hypothetical protein
MCALIYIHVCFTRSHIGVKKRQCRYGLTLKAQESLRLVNVGLATTVQHGDILASNMGTAQTRICSATSKAQDMRCIYRLTRSLRDMRLHSHESPCPQGIPPCFLCMCTTRCTCSRGLMVHKPVTNLEELGIVAGVQRVEEGLQVGDRADDSQNLRGIHHLLLQLRSRQSDN